MMITVNEDDGHFSKDTKQFFTFEYKRLACFDATDLLDTKTRKENTQMDNPTLLRAIVIPMINQYYQSDSHRIPPRRPRINWEADNQRGFFLALVLGGGEERHVRELYDLLLQASSQKVKDELSFSAVKGQPSFLDRMFAYYIQPFHMHYTGASRCATPVIPLGQEGGASHSAPPPSPSLEKSEEPTHNDLKLELSARDGACLFCWRSTQLQAAHIVAQKNAFWTAIDEPSIFERTGLTKKHQVQNGLLLCPWCHLTFDQLKLYVDEVDKKLVVKVAHPSDDPKSLEYKKWEREKRILLISRNEIADDFQPHRKAVEENGEMALYFAQIDQSREPNREALAWHKRACLMWRMAGGADPEVDEDDSCDEEGEGVPVGYYQSNNVVKEWLQSLEDSSRTLTTDE